LWPGTWRWIQDAFSFPQIGALLGVPIFHTIPHGPCDVNELTGTHGDVELIVFEDEGAQIEDETIQISLVCGELHTPQKNKLQRCT
jgi:hypothetical protein